MKIIKNIITKDWCLYRCETTESYNKLKNDLGNNYLCTIYTLELTSKRTKKINKEMYNTTEYEEYMRLTRVGNDEYERGNIRLANKLWKKADKIERRLEKVWAE